MSKVVRIIPTLCSTINKLNHEVVELNDECDQLYDKIKNNKSDKSNEDMSLEERQSLELASKTLKEFNKSFNDSLVRKEKRRTN